VLSKMAISFSDLVDLTGHKISYLSDSRPGRGVSSYPLSSLLSNTRMSQPGSKIFSHLCSGSFCLRCINLIAEASKLADHSCRVLSL
jgi:hypothetical protein